MKIQRLSFEGLGGYQKKAELDFSNLGLVLLDGENGSGKSSILDSLTWILFDKTVRGVSKDGWLNETTQKGWGTVVLTGDKIYEITRIRDRSGVKLILKEDGQEIQLRRTQDSQEYVEEKIGSYDLFVNSVMFGQGDLLELAFATDSRRKEIVGELLGFDEIDHVLDVLKEQYRLVELAISSLDTILFQYKHQLEELKYVTEESWSKVDKDIADVVLQLEQVKATRETIEKKSLLLKECKRYTDKIEQLEKQLLQKSELSQRLEELKSQLSVFAECEAKRVVVEKQLEQITDELNALSFEKGQFVFLQDSLQEKIQQLTKIEGQCPTCLQTLSEVKRQEILTKLQGELNKIYVDMEKINENFVIKKNTQDELKKTVQMLKNQLKVVKQLEAEHAVIEEKLKVLNQCEDELNRLKEEITQLVIQVPELLQEKLVEQIQDMLLQLECELQKSQLQETELQERRLNLEKTKARIESRLTMKNEFSKKVSNVEVEYTKRKEQLRHLEFLVDLLGLKGVKNIVLGNVIPFLEKEMNIYLGFLLPQVRVEFSTQRQGKNKAYNEFTINLFEYGNENSRDFRLWSGGEKMLICLALRFALWRMLHLFGRRPLDILFLDEVFGCLDDIHRDKVFEFLEWQQHELQIPIIVVEHIPEIKERFGFVLSVRKGLNGSEIG
ncbi:MAG TPA: SMC family ATPase [Methanofastidiosum sp.]|nr:SMC family ATPase [Methanofastidiosum sp.]